MKEKAAFVISKESSTEISVIAREKISPFGRNDRGDERKKGFLPSVEMTERIGKRMDSCFCGNDIAQEDDGINRDESAMGIGLSFNV